MTCRLQNAATDEKPKARYSSDRILRMVSQNPMNSAGIWDEIFVSTANGVPDQILSEAIALLHEQKYYDAAVEGLMAAIRNGYGAPWMYEVLPDEMSVAGRPAAEVARVVESRVDFATTDVPQLLIAVAMLSRFESWDRANVLAEEAAELDPLQSDVWLLGRSVADKSGDTRHRVRTRCGILKNLWSPDHAAQHDEARKTLAEIIASLSAAGDSADADEVRRQLDDAGHVDLQLVLRWVGTADLDLSVTEPGGEVCDFKSRVTNVGGRLVQETGVASQEAASRQALEHYVCHTAPSGQYEVAVNFVLGKAVTGTAVLDVIRHAGSAAEVRESHTIKLGKDPAKLSINLDNGRAK